MDVAERFPPLPPKGSGLIEFISCIGVLALQRFTEWYTPLWRTLHAYFHDYLAFVQRQTGVGRGQPLFVFTAFWGVFWGTWLVSSLSYILLVLSFRLIVHTVVGFAFGLVGFLRSVRAVFADAGGWFEPVGGHLAPILRVLATPAADTIAFNRAVAEEIPLRQNPTPVVDLSTTRTEYDARGPYVKTTFNGIEMIVRLNAPTLTKTSPPSPIETGGKEAVLVSSVRPQKAQLPASQISILLDGVHHGWAVRYNETTLLLTRHQLEQMLGFAGSITLSRGEKQIPLKKLQPTGKFPHGSDYAGLSVESGLFSALQASVAKHALPMSGPFELFTYDDAQQTALCLGKMERSEDSNLIFVHNAWSRKGTSGAGIWQNSKLVGVHTGSNASATENYATSITYVDTYLNPNTTVNESFHADGNHSRDVLSEDLLQRLQREEFSHRANRNSELATIMDDLTSEIQERRYQESIFHRDQIEDMLERSKLDDLTQNEIKSYLYGQSGTRGMSKKNAKKYGHNESDIKEESLLSSETLSSPKAKPSSKGSKRSVTPPQSAPALEKPKTPSSTPSEMETLIEGIMERSLKKHLPSQPQTEALSSSSTHSSSNKGSLYDPQLAASLASEKASKKRSKTTR